MIPDLISTQQADRHGLALLETLSKLVLMDIDTVNLREAG
jgi:hypothetical protein